MTPPECHSRVIMNVQTDKDRKGIYGICLHLYRESAFTFMKEPLFKTLNDKRQKKITDGISSLVNVRGLNGWHSHLLTV